MIKVTIELWPLGNKEEKSLLAEGTITNDGTGTAKEGNYKYFFTAHDGRSKIGGRVCGYRRLDHSVLYLMNMVFEKAYRKK